MGFIRKNPSSSAALSPNANVIWHNVGIPCPTGTVEEALLEASYSAFYQSDTYNQISAVVADLPVAHPTLDPGSKDFIGNPPPISPLPHAITKSLQRNFETPWPGKFQPGSNRPGGFHPRSQSDVARECPALDRIEIPPRSKSDAGFITETPFDLSTPFNPTFPPYSKYYKPASRNTSLTQDDDDHDDSGISRPIVHHGSRHRLSELIDPADLLIDYDSRFGSFSSSSSSTSSFSTSNSTNTSTTRTRSPSPISSRSISAISTYRKPLPPVLESPSGTLFSASEFATHPNRPLAIRERQEHIRAAIESLDSQTRAARSESRAQKSLISASGPSGKGKGKGKGSGKANGDGEVWWKVGFGSDSRKGSHGSEGSRKGAGAGAGVGSTVYNGFGGDTRAIPSPVPLVAQMLPRRIGVRRTMEEERVEEGRRAYASKAARGERGWGLGAWRGRKR